MSETPSNNNGVSNGARSNCECDHTNQPDKNCVEQEEQLDWLHDFSNKKSAITLTLNAAGILNIIFALIRLTNGQNEGHFEATLALLIAALILQITLALSQLFFSAQGVSKDKDQRIRHGIINNIMFGAGFFYVLITFSVQALYMIDCCPSQPDQRGLL